MELKQINEKNTIEFLKSFEEYITDVKDEEYLVNVYLKKIEIDTKDNKRDNYYTIDELKDILKISRSQIYKLLKNESGIIDRGIKKYNEDVLFSLMCRKRK